MRLPIVACVLVAASCAPPGPEPSVGVVALPRAPPPPPPPPAPPPAASSTHRPVEAPPADARAIACDRGDKEACAALASRCSIGTAAPDVPWESPACAERERKACEAGEASYCRNLGDRYTSTTGEAGVPKDEAIGIKLIERACLGGGGFDNCVQIAYRYEGGIGLPKDPARAVALFEGVCDEESGVLPQPCQALARHLVSGEGVAKDPPRAARIHAAACGQGACDADALVSLCSDAGGKAKTNVGCVSLAIAITTLVAGAPPTNPRKAKSLLEAACRRRDAAGCRELARWYAGGRKWPDGSSTPQDDARADALMKQACDAGDESACGGR